MGQRTMGTDIFQDKVAIVTGAASGIGRELAAELGRRGAQVVAADINTKEAEVTAGGIKVEGGRARSASLDVSDAGAVRKLADETAAEFGRIDYMFNNAGIAISGEMKDLDLADWRRVIEVDLWGVIHGTQAAYAHMIRQGSGHIVNTGSTASLVPFPLATPYVAAKHAVMGFSTSLRSEAEAYGVKVSVICPGIIDTRIYTDSKFVKLDREKSLGAMPRWLMMSPQKCARIILRGVERNKSIIVVGWIARLMWRNYRTSPAFYIWMNRFVRKRIMGKQ